MPAGRFFLFSILLQVSLFTFPHSTAAQEFSYRHYTVRDGLVQNQVITMFQDASGYIWIGTKGGVSRFDGISFVNYTVNDGLLSNHIVKVFEDARGRIYFCSLIGVSRIEDGIIETVLLNDTIRPGNEMVILPRFTETEMCVLNSNHIPVYFAPYDSILVRGLSQIDSARTLSIVKELGSDKYWIRDSKTGLYCLQGDSLQLMIEDFKGGLLQTKTGQVCAFERNTFYFPDPASGRLVKTFEFPEEPVHILYDIDSRGVAYFGAGQKNVVVLDRNGMTTYKKKFNYINKMLIDAEENLWIGTETGFYRKISNAFENFTPETGTNEYVWSIVEDGQRNIWFASYGDGLGIWDGESFRRVQEVKEVYEGVYYYTGACRAADQSLYFPVREKGVLHFDGTRFELIPDLPRGSVLDVYEDHDNDRLLAASTAGLVVMEKNLHPSVIPHIFNQTKSYIKTIAQDKYDRYWLGGEYLLNVYDGEEFLNFPNADYSYNHGAISLCRDHHGNMWLGTTSGLYYYDYQSFTKVGADVLRSQVASFVEYDTSRLMMGVSEGLAILDLTAFYSNNEARVDILDAASGFMGYDCIRNGILKDSQGSVWIAASDRVVKFYPEKLYPDTIPPDVHIGSVTASPSPDTQREIQKYYFPFDTIIELHHTLQNVRIDFHAVHFRAPEKIRYQYRLVGYGEGWTDPDFARYASYTNLEPGSYSFEVRAINRDGVQSTLPAVISFRIVPAFWQTYPFRILANISVGLLLLLISLWIISFRRKRRQKLQETERQISELQLKTIRSQMDPHFTFNALNTISSVIYKEDKEKAYRYFTKFSRLVRSSLEASDKITRTLKEEIDFTRNYLDLEKIRFKDNFKYSIEVDEDVQTDMLIPKMIIQSYAENAVKHGLKHLEKDRRLQISITRQVDQIMIMIEDNGIGRRKAAAKSKTSTGKGLAIMQSIFELYHKMYRIRISQATEDLFDRKGHPSGTRVIIAVPLLKSKRQD